MALVDLGQAIAKFRRNTRRDTHGSQCPDFVFGVDKKLRLQGNDFLEETRRYSQTDLRHQQVASRQISLELQLLLLPVKITIYSDDDFHTYGHPNSRTFGQWFRCR